MARPTDWSPLAGSDPVPGDPGRISQEAAHLSSVAGQIHDQVGQLRAIASGQSVEKGLHVDKLKSASADVANSLDKVIGRYQKTSDALGAWVPELEYAQNLSLKALTMAQDAAGRQRANRPATYPSGYTETAQDKQNDQQRANALNQANADLAAARQMLDRATSHRDQKGSETRNKIENAIQDGVTDSWWESTFGNAWDSFSNWVTEHADLIKKIADIASLIATICGILSLLVGWIPIIGQALAVILDTAATIATAVSLICHLMLAITGNGSWLDVGLDVLALATLGMGRAFAKVGERGFEAAQAATRSPLARMLGKAGLGLVRSDVTAEAERITGMSWTEAQGILTEARSGLKLPNWAEAALSGQNPVKMWQETMGSFKTIGQWLTGGLDSAAAWKSVFPAIGDASMLGKLQDFSAVVERLSSNSLGDFSHIADLPSVVKWTDIANPARINFYISTGIGTGADLFDKTSTWLAGLHLPGLSQWNQLKGG
jgi:hypothetical protein